MKQRLKGIIGIIIMFAALAATYLWMNYGQARLESVSLLVAAKDIPKGTIIDSANSFFKIESISLSSAVLGALKPEQADLLNGKTAESFIPANGQIMAQNFSDNSLILKDNEFVFKLPPEWVYSIPSSIRRGDKISIYEIDCKIDSQTDQGAGLNIVPVNGKPESILDTTVQFVKDSTNREVTDANEKVRQDGTSQVSSIEIICTREDTQKLESSVLSGKKLIVVYR